MYRLEFDTSSEVATATVRSALIAYLEEETGSGQDLLPVEQIFNELVANVLQHGGRWVTIAVDWLDDGTCALQVIDRGPGLDLHDWQPPPTLAEHGHGLVLLGALCKDVAIVGGPDGLGARVTAILPIHQRILSDKALAELENGKKDPRENH